MSPSACTVGLVSIVLIAAVTPLHVKVGFAVVVFCHEQGMKLLGLLLIGSSGAGHGKSNWVSLTCIS